MYISDEYSLVGILTGATYSFSRHASQVCIRRILPAIVMIKERVSKVNTNRCSMSD